MKALLLGPCLAAYWVCLSAWLAALVTAAVSAAQVFSNLPGVSMTLERFAAYPGDDHGRLAAGLVMAEIFYTVDVVQFIVVPLVVGTLGLQLTVLGLPWRRPANLIRTAAVIIAAGSFAWYAIALAPHLNRTLRAYWAAAEAGNLAEAAALHEQFAAGHEFAELTLSVNFLLIVVAVVASAVALAPTPARGLPIPALVRS